MMKETKQYYERCDDCEGLGWIKSGVRCEECRGKGFFPTSTPTPTFRVDFSMLRGNPTMRVPVISNFSDGIKNVDKFENMEYMNAMSKYYEHLASLRNYPIAPGCKFEGNNLIEDIDFAVSTHTYSTGTYAEAINIPQTPNP